MKSQKLGKTFQKKLKYQELLKMEYGLSQLTMSTFFHLKITRGLKKQVLKTFAIYN